MIAGIRIVTDGGSVELAVDAASVDARRDLGVVAWSVLELVALAGTKEGGVWVATTNARDLAGRLGVGKDRVAAALGVLRAAGLVVARTSRDASTSRFAPSRYEVRLPLTPSREPVGSEVEPRPPRPPAPRTRRRDTTPPDALDLFSSP